MPPVNRHDDVPRLEAKGAGRRAIARHVNTNGRFVVRQGTIREAVRKDLIARRRPCAFVLAFLPELHGAVVKAQELRVIVVTLRTLPIHVLGVVRISQHGARESQASRVIRLHDRRERVDVAELGSADRR